MGIELYKIIQLVVSSSGLVLNIWGLRDALKDKAALRELGLNGHRKLTAINNISQEGIRLFVQLLLVAVGVLGVVFPSSPHNLEGTALILSYVYRSIFMLASLALASKSIIDRIYRVMLLDMWLTEHNVERRKADSGPPEGTAERRKERLH